MANWSRGVLLTAGKIFEKITALQPPESLRLEKKLKNSKKINEPHIVYEI